MGMRYTVIALLLALAGCQLQEPTVRGTVVSVMEIPVEGLGESPKRYEDPLVPEFAWKVEVRLEDGRALTLTQPADRRYEPGQRVRVLLNEEHALLL